MASNPEHNFTQLGPNRGTDNSQPPTVMRRVERERITQAMAEAHERLGWHAQQPAKQRASTVLPGEVTLTALAKVGLLTGLEQA